MNPQGPNNTSDGTATCRKGHMYPATLSIVGGHNSLNPSRCPTCREPSESFSSVAVDLSAYSKEPAKPATPLPAGASQAQKIVTSLPPQPPVTVNLNFPVRWVVVAMLMVMFAAAATCSAAVINYANTAVQYMEHKEKN